MNEIEHLWTIFSTVLFIWVKIIVKISLGFHLFCNESKSDGVHKLFMLWNESAQLHSITWWLCQGLATIRQKLGGKVLE
jgi:hypothetical protein